MSVDHDITAKNLIASGFRPLHAGDDYDYTFNFNEDTPSGEIPLNLTGAKLWFTIKEDAIDADASAKLQLDSDDTAQIEITDPTNGKFVVKFVSSGAKTTESLEGLWDYDIQVKRSSGRVNTIATGKIEFLPSITRTIT